ncbi:MAG TPA: hypothetical protein VGC79_28270 [Polyangiaceae bacterium]
MKTYGSLLVLVCCLLIVACQPPVKKVSTDVGKGTRQGSPPLCYDYRGEAQATDKAGVSNIWAYLNNTCSYAVDCTIYNDATEQESRISVNPYKQLRFLLASGAPAKRVHLKLECSWTP